MTLGMVYTPTNPPLEVEELGGPGETGLFVRLMSGREVKDMFERWPEDLRTTDGNAQQYIAETVASCVVNQDGDTVCTVSELLDTLPFPVLVRCFRRVMFLNGLAKGSLEYAEKKS